MLRFLQSRMAVVGALMDGLPGQGIPSWQISILESLEIDPGPRAQPARGSVFRFRSRHRQRFHLAVKTGRSHSGGGWPYGRLCAEPRPRIFVHEEDWLDQVSERGRTAGAGREGGNTEGIFRGETISPQLRFL